MKKRRAFLGTVGALALDSTPTMATSENGEDPGDNDPSPECTGGSDTESIETTDFNSGGVVVLDSKVTEDRTFDINDPYMEGDVGVIWSPTDDGDAQEIELIIEITASGIDASISDAPPDFTVSGNTATSTVTVSDSNNLTTSFGQVSGSAFYCPPDMQYETLANITTNRGNQYSESHTLDVV